MKFIKNIYLYWGQGWDNVPPVIKYCKDSWAFHNPSWNLILLDDNNVTLFGDLTKYPKYPKISRQAFSDILRLNLLSKCGGVWADATMLCTQSLDNWIDEALQPCGFWMFHGRDLGRGPASWFMASTPHSFISDEWLKACDTFWSNNNDNVEYFWMDRLFSKIIIKNEKFLKDWESVPFKNCEELGSAHSVAKDGYFEQFKESLLTQIDREVPFALKLKWSGELHPLTSEWSILAWAFKMRQGLKPKWGQLGSQKGADYFSTQRPRKFFIDCGTHFGQGLDLFINKFNIDQSWIVHSFEANPITYELNKKNNIEFVHYHNNAVGDKEMQIELNIESPQGRERREWEALSLPWIFGTPKKVNYKKILKHPALLT
ncbi:hypothetical protein G6720_04155 [Polynucleobacter paneuropaeus]|nr:hypothetical protein G6720_04155 [Polynucleobacter paneuropaeus]